MNERSGKQLNRKLPRVNFRPIAFFALWLACGIFLYCKCRFGGLKATDVLFCLFFCLVAFRRPLLSRRTAAVAAALVCAAGAGVLSIHLYTENFDAAKADGYYSVAGTVTSVTVGSSYTSLTLSGVSLDGEKTGGNMRVIVTADDVRAGDIISFSANVTKTNVGKLASNSAVSARFVGDIRYTATASRFVRKGRSKNVFLALNAALYDTLASNMEGDEASVAYALLTGNSGGIDAGLLDAVRKGGIAHIFAVSGLHIGILYAAVSLIARPLGKYRVIPATAVSVCYSAFCGFAVSSVRAVVMCASAGVWNALGRKTDFLNSIAFAAIIVLLVSPAQWLSVGFRLSFGACLGLALFSGSMSRAMKKLPPFLRGYLSANFSVQIFTFPVLMESFGYYSVWGTLLNFFLIPALPVLFLGLIACSLLALIIPPGAGFFLLFPQSMLSLLIFVFSAADFSLTLTGIALGAGSAVWLCGCILLSEKFRLSPVARCASACVLCFLFGLCIVFENAVFVGCKIVVYANDGANAVLVRTVGESVLVLDGDISLRESEDFLSRTYGGKLDAVVVLSEDEVSAVNVAAFLGAEEVRAKDEVVTGLRITNVAFGDSFSLGALSFRYESREKIALFAEGRVIEIDFCGSEALRADLFINSACGGLIFFLHDGIIKAI